MVNMYLFTIILAVLVWHLKVLNLSPVLLLMMVSYMLRNSTHGLRDWGPMEFQSSRVKNVHAPRGGGTLPCSAGCWEMPHSVIHSGEDTGLTTLVNSSQLLESSSFFNANWGRSVSFPCQNHLQYPTSPSFPHSTKHSRSHELHPQGYTNTLASNYTKSTRHHIDKQPTLLKKPSVSLISDRYPYSLIT